MTQRERVAYRQAGEAMRASIDAALAAPLTLGQMKVLAAIYREIPSYSRVVDNLKRRRLAELTGLTEKTVSKALPRLAEVGAIVFEKSKGRGLGLIGLRETSSSEVPVSRTATRQETGTSRNGNGNSQAANCALSEKTEVREDISARAEHVVITLAARLGQSGDNVRKHRNYSDWLEITVGHLQQEMPEAELLNVQIASRVDAPFAYLSKILTTPFKSRTGQMVLRDHVGTAEEHGGSTTCATPR